MKNQKNVVTKKESHSRTLLSGIYNVCLCQIKDNSLLNRCVEAPRVLRTVISGMTTNLMSGLCLTYREEALNKSSSRAPLRSGFTLIELLVVILIIGILAAVAVPQYQLAVTKSRYAALKNMVKALASAQEVYYWANGQYAAKFTDLDVDAGGTPEDQLDNKRNFDWGYCYLDTTYVLCTGAAMSYQLYYVHSREYLVEKRRCVAWNDDFDSVQNKVCKQETKDENPLVITGVRIGWVYTD